MNTNSQLLFYLNLTVYAGGAMIVSLLQRRKLRFRDIQAFARDTSSDVESLRQGLGSLCAFHCIVQCQGVRAQLFPRSKERGERNS